MILLPRIWTPDHRREAIQIGRAVKYRPAGERPSSIAGWRTALRRRSHRRSCYMSGGIINPFSLGGPFLCDAADFDGSNDYMNRGGDLTGAADSKLWLYSVWWIRVSGNNDTRSIISGKYDASNQRVGTWVLYSGGNLVHDMFATDASGNSVFAFILGSGAAFDVWHHTLVALDIGNNVGQQYLDDSSWGTFIRVADAAMDFTLSDWYVGAHFNATQKYQYGMAELYHAPAQYLDISQSSNRAKFRSAGGKPVSLGSNGSTPTGTAPKIYLHIADGETPNNYATNLGTGGGFTLTGSLGTYSSSPSD